VRRRTLAGPALASVLMAVILVACGTASTDASWTTAETATGSFTAGTINAPRSLTCAQPILSQPIFSWLAPATGLAPASYHWQIAQGAVVAASGDVASPTITMSSPSLLATGSYKFSVVATSVGGWTSPSSPTGTYNIAIGLLTSCSVP
jgi:hypothetical protein